MPPTSSPTPPPAPSLGNHTQADDAMPAPFCMRISSSAACRFVERVGAAGQALTLVYEDGTPVEAPK